MRVLITGASGQLGGYLTHRFVADGASVVAWSGPRGRPLSDESGAAVPLSQQQRGSLGPLSLRERVGVRGVRLQPVDLTDRSAVESAFRDVRPDLVVHAAAVSSVAAAHRDLDRASAVNTAGTALLAELAGRHGNRVVYISTDLVFDGERAPYREGDRAIPLSDYGRTKLRAEPTVLAVGRGLVLRLSLLFGPSRVGRPTFFDQQVTSLYERRPMRLFDDEWRTPLDLKTAAEAIARAATSEQTGLLHLGGPERMSRYEMGRRLAAVLDADASVFVPQSRLAADAAEPRPRDTSLDSSRWCSLFPDFDRPGFEEAVRAMLKVV